jgi:apolipoprotein N-acyltransferase
MEWRAQWPTLRAGAALLLALRAAITGAAWPWIAAWLAAAGLAHLADLRTRWSRKAR